MAANLACDDHWTALVLAGERPGDGFAGSLGAPCKALIAVGGRPMLWRVVETLLAHPRIGAVHILSQRPERLMDEAPQALRGDARLCLARSSDGIARSVGRFLMQPATRFPVLVTTADHALLTAEIVEDFLDQCGDADVCVGLVEKGRLLSAYPQSRRTWLHFSDGAFTGANLFALRSAKSLRALSFWAGVEQDRKRVLRLFWKFGPGLFVRAVTRTITLRAAMARAGTALGLLAMPILLNAPEAGIDVDKLQDLILAESIILERDGGREPFVPPGPSASADRRQAHRQP